VLTAATPGPRESPPDQAVSLRLRAVGGLPPLRWSFEGLPPGLDWNSGGSVAGSPATPGTFTVTATVTDARRASDAVTFAWTVTSP